MAMQINLRVRALLAHTITTEMYWVLEHSSIPTNEVPDYLANTTQDAS
jgi:hypothetical protein